MPTEQADGGGLFQPVHISTSASWTRSTVCSTTAQFPLDAAGCSWWVCVLHTVTWILIDFVTGTHPLTWLVGWQEGHPACKKEWRVLAWLSGARCRLAYGPADATATHWLFFSVKSRLVLSFSYRLTWVVPEKGPLSVCVWYIGNIQLLLNFVKLY